MNMDFVDLTVDSDDERRLHVPPSVHDEETLLVAPDIIQPKNIKTENGPFTKIFDLVNSSVADPRPSTSAYSRIAEHNPSTSENSPTTEQILFTSTNSSTADQNPSTSINSSTAEPKPTMPDNASKAEPNPTTFNNSSTAEQNPSTSNNSSTAEQHESTSINLKSEPKPTTSESSSKAKNKNRRRKSKKTNKDNKSSSENDTLISDTEKDTTSKNSSKAKKKNRKRSSKETDKSCSENASASESDTTSESKPKKKKRKPSGKIPETKKQEKQKSFIKEAIQEAIQESESIDDDLAEIWEYTLKKGLQEKKRDLLQKFSYPENCKLLKAPILNYITIFQKEMKINKVTKEADNVVRRRQDQLGLGIGAIGKVINLLAELNNEKLKESIQILTNAGQILADVHYSETEARKRAFFPKDTHQFIDQLERDETLFGRNVFNLGLRPPASSVNFFNHGPNKNR